jgi:hypothetical protein
MYPKIVKVVSASLVLALAVALAACGEKKKEEAKPKVEPVASFDLFVMSKCPYGVQAEDEFAKVIEKLGGAVAVNIAFIGEEKDGKLESMHGETEVKGNTLQLCAGDLKPEKQLEFISCMNADWRNIPEGWEKCATKAGLDTAAIKACADGAKGTQLLKASFEKSAKAGAQGSPTIKLNGEDYKGGRLARDITRAVCDKHADKVPACAKLPPPPEIEGIAITDPRCGEKCDPKMVFTSLKEVFPGLKTTVYNWGQDPEAEAIAKEVGGTMLPIVLFNETLAKDPEGTEQMARWLEAKGKYKMLKVKPEFDPTAEICDNGKDDTGDGKVDCADPTCVGKMACRAEPPKTLEAFIMSQCPYGVMGVNAMKDVLAAFGKDITFTIHYIGEEANGTVQSMHGQGEVDEDVRALCAAKLYGKNNKYLDYLWCRGKAAPADDWKTCATGAINAGAIEKCATSDEGKNLLKEDIKIAKALDIAASPTWIVNGKTQFNGIAPADIQTNYCGKNAGLAGCAVKLKSMQEIQAEMGQGAGPGGPGGAPPPAGGSCGQ